MGLLSDKQIKARCMKPTHFLQDTTTGKFVPVIPGVTHPAEQVANWENLNLSRLVKATPAKIKEFGWKPMIEPFFDAAVSEHNGVGVMSYGVSSYGYDLRMSSEQLKVFSNLSGNVVDPLAMDPSNYVTPIVYEDGHGRKYYIQPPTSVTLGHSPEYFNIPRDVLITCLGKSTMARAGLSVIVTPLEPEWDGQLVIEVVNHISSPVKVYLEMGIGQLLFHKGDEVCEVSYRDRKGKYNGQTGTQDSLAKRVIS